MLEIKEWNLILRRCEFVSITENDDTQAFINNVRHKLEQLSEIHSNVIFADDYIQNHGKSDQVFETLKKQSKKKLVISTIMDDLQAENWASRRIYISNGSIVHDTAPLSNRDIQLEKIKDQYEVERNKMQDKPSNSFGASFSLSLTSLIKQKGWTALILLLCTIGICIAVILLSI